MNMTGLGTPLPESNTTNMKFDAPKDYRIRCLYYKSYYEIWLPVITPDEENGGFKTVKRFFQFKNYEIMRNSIFSRLASAERAAKKELLGDVDEAKRSGFQPRKRFKLIGFNLSGIDGADPNVLSFFTFGSKLETELATIAWGTKKTNPRILEYGPLWAQDIFITRKGTGQFDTEWHATPVEKLGPFEGQLTTDLKNPAKLAEWMATQEFSKFFTPEQLAAMEGQDLESLLDGQLKFLTEEEMVKRLLTEPINLGYEQDGKPLVITSVIPHLVERFVHEAKRLQIGGNLYLLAAPKLEGDVEFAIEVEKPAPEIAEAVIVEAPKATAPAPVPVSTTPAPAPVEVPKGVVASVEPGDVDW